MGHLYLKWTSHMTPLAAYIDIYMPKKCFHVTFAIYIEMSEKPPHQNLLP